MARGNVDVKITIVGDKAVDKYVDLQKRGLAPVAAGFDQIGQRSGRAGRAASGSFRHIQRDATRAVSVFAGVGTAIGSLVTLAQVLRNELENVVELQVQSGRSQVTVAKAQRGAAFALGTKGVDTSLSIDEVTAMLEGSPSGVPLEQLLDEAQSALSSRGQLPAERAVETVLEAARLRPELESESRKRLETAAIAVQKAFGVDVAESLAGVQQSLLAARAEDIGTFSKNLIPAIVQSRSFGPGTDEFDFLASLFIGVGQRAEDPSSRRTATNVLKFIEQVMTQARIRGISDETTTIEETFNRLLSSPNDSEANKLRRELVGVFDENLADVPIELQEFKKATLLGEAKTRVAIMEVLANREKDSGVWKEINAANSKIAGLNQEAVRLMEQMLNHLRALPEQQAAEAQRAVNQSLARQRLRDPAGLSGLTAEGMRELLLRTGSSRLQTRLGVWLRQMGASIGKETQEEQLQAWDEILRRQEQFVREGDPVLSMRGILGTTVRGLGGVGGFMRPLLPVHARLQLRDQDLDPDRLRDITEIKSVRQRIQQQRERLRTRQLPDVTPIEYLRERVHTIDERDLPRPAASRSTTAAAPPGATAEPTGYQRALVDTMTQLRDFLGVLNERESRATDAATSSVRTPRTVQ